MGALQRIKNVYKQFKLKNNGYTLSMISESFSENFTKPIEWKVDDGWFSLPNLFIRTGARKLQIRFYWIKSLYRI
ncbi:hypothetical protein ACW95P_00365 [Candidatus Mycoplasma pogonae]